MSKIWSGWGLEGREFWFIGWLYVYWFWWLVGRSRGAIAWLRCFLVVSRCLGRSMFIILLFRLIGR